MKQKKETKKGRPVSSFRLLSNRIWVHSRESNFVPATGLNSLSEFIYTWKRNVAPPPLALRRPEAMAMAMASKESAAIKTIQHRSGTSEARGHDPSVSLSLSVSVNLQQQPLEAKMASGPQPYICLGRRTIPGSALVPVRTRSWYPIQFSSPSVL
jgi:hypothetical protein